MSDEICYGKREDCDALRDEAARLHAELERKRDAESLLQNLLACIHRDGGHYSEQHGLSASCKSAREIITAMRVSLEELERAQKQAAAVLDDHGRLVLANNKLEREAAAMREALEQIRGDGSVNIAGSGPAWTRMIRSIHVANTALASDAGRDYVSKEHVKPLVETLKEVESQLRVLDWRRHI